MSDYGYAYGAAAAYAAAPFDNLSPLPGGFHLDREQFGHHEDEDEDAVDLEYLGYQYDLPEHVGLDVDVDRSDDDGLGGSNNLDIDVYDQEDIDLDPEPADDNWQPLPLSPLLSPRAGGSSDLSHSPSEGAVGDEQDDSEDEDAVQQQQHHHHPRHPHYPQIYAVPDSDDDSDQLSQSDVEIPDSPTYDDLDDDDDNDDVNAGIGQDHVGEGSSREQSALSIDDDQSDSSRTASLPPAGAYVDHSTLSPSPPPVSLLLPEQQRHDESDANLRSGSDSDLITISDDSDIETASARGTASQPGSVSVVTASSSSQGSRSGPRGPHHRQPLRRLSDHSDPDIDFNNIHPRRVSPRLSSLTPVIHPNRRLPRRQSPDILQSPLDVQSATSDPSTDSSADELILPQPQRRLGIERTRRPIFSNAQPLSSDENNNNSSGSNSTSIDEFAPYPLDSSDSEPTSQHRSRRSIVQPLDDHSDPSVGIRLGSSSPPQGGEEDTDLFSQSDLDEDFEFNDPSRDGGSQAGGPATGHIHLDGAYADEEGDIVLQDHQENPVGRAEDLHAREASSNEDAFPWVARQRRRIRDRLLREVRQQQEEEAAARERRRRAARNPFLDSDLDEQSDANMDGDDELVEVVFDRQLNGPHAPPLQRQPRQQQQRQRINRNSNSNNNNRGQAVELIDLTEEPDSPVQNHGFQNQSIAHQQYNRSQQRPRHHRRMGNGQPPSLARSDGSLLGSQRGPAVIDLTNDEPDFQAVVDDDDDDLFVGQDFDDVLEHLPPDDFDDFLRHIPANRRLPDPVPGPPHRDRRRSVEFIGFAARHLRNVGGQYLPGLLAALPGMPRGIANEIAIIGRDPGLAMNPNPLADNPPDFNYQANGFGGRPPPPKPEFEAPPPARPGFTRNTGVDPETGEELEIVCASCDNELKYDDEEDDGPRPAKRPRNKKDREEHHFWAVKACGHVYCKSCYDNRKKTKGKDYAELDMHFRVEQSATAKSAKIFCAVDNCESDVTQNNSWVGIFM
ncbi:hypothetical protein N0V82_009357 [Gnomoniopsis sp. IMI 355080]|nr:hypothetical protein N0V82_009357 [Gnomoniopsis sp. IMI 355080]